MADTRTTGTMRGETAARSGAGRPPRVTRAQIAHAALEIGLHRATIRSVADRLGMSVPGLYHHVRTRQELLDLAMEHVLTGLPASWAGDAPWREKLLAYAEKMFEAMAAQPDLITRIASGSVVSVEYAFHVEAFMAGARAHGFSTEQGYKLHIQLLTTVIGAAAIEAGHRALRNSASSLGQQIAAVAGNHDPAEFPELRALLAYPDLLEADPMEPVRMKLDALLEQFDCEAC